MRNLTNAGYFGFQYCKLRITEGQLNPSRAPANWDHCRSFAIKRKGFALLRMDIQRQDASVPGVGRRCDIGSAFLPDGADRGRLPEHLGPSSHLVNVPL